jgi:outer membrane protein, adhesin transport system
MSRGVCPSWITIAAVAVIVASTTALGTTASGMTMHEAVGLAVDGNPEIGEAAANREAIEFELRQGRGQYLPRVDLRGRAGGVLRDSATTRLQNNDDDWMFEREVSLVVRQLLFDGFGVDAEVERQASRVDAASFRVLERSEFIALAVVREYLDIARLRRIVTIARENVAYHQGLLERVDEGVEAGALSTADRDQAEERLFAANAQVSEATEDLKAADARFIRFVGRHVGNVSRPPAVSPALPGSLAYAVGLARTNNPTVKIIRADLDSAYAQVKAAESRFYPELALEGRARHGNDLGGISGHDNELRAGIVLNWNLYSGGIDRAKRQEQIRRVDEEAMQLHMVSREVEEAVRLSWDRRQQQTERLALLRQQEIAARQLIGSYSDQFAIGQRSLLDLLGAQATYTNVRITVETAAAAVRFAEYRILAATGTLLTTLGIAAPPQAVPYAREQARLSPTPPAPTMSREPPGAGLGPLY